MTAATSQKSVYFIHSKKTVSASMAATLRADGKWFEKHPQANEYIRPMSADEIMLCWVAPGWIVTGGVTRVTKIGPGVRERQMLRIDTAAAGRVNPSPSRRNHNDV
jgi:hypothetical protein